MVGNVGLRPKVVPERAVPGQLVQRVEEKAAVPGAGVKRRAEEVSSDSADHRCDVGTNVVSQSLDDEPRHKRRAMSAEELRAAPSRS